MCDETLLDGLSKMTMKKLGKAWGDCWGLSRETVELKCWKSFKKPLWRRYWVGVSLHNYIISKDREIEMKEIFIFICNDCVVPVVHCGPDLLITLIAKLIVLLYCTILGTSRMKRSEPTNLGEKLRHPVVETRFGGGTLAIHERLCMMSVLTALNRNQVDPHVLEFRIHANTAYSDWGQGLWMMPSRHGSIA